MSRRTKIFLVNALTMGRIPLMLLFLAVNLFMPGDGGRSGWLFVTAFAALVVSGVTDFLDGFLARRYGATSRLGALADPVLDKAYFIVSLPVLVQRASLLPGESAHGVALLFLTVVMLARDQTLSIVRIAASGRGQNVGAALVGKIRTFYLLVLIPTIYWYLDAPRPWQFLPKPFVLWAEIVAVILTVVSLVLYGRRYGLFARQPLGEPRRSGETRAAVSMLLSLVCFAPCAVALSVWRGQGWLAGSGEGWAFAALCAVLVAAYAGQSPALRRSNAPEPGLFSMLAEAFFPLCTLLAITLVAYRTAGRREGDLLLALTVVTLLHDQWVSFLRSVGAPHGVEARANRADRVRTAIAFPTICCAFWYLAVPQPFGLPMPPAVVYALEWAGLAATLVSLGAYTAHYLPCVRKEMEG